MRSLATSIAVVLAAALPTAAQAASQYVIEAPALQQVVQLSADDLRGADRVPVVEQRIRAAARAVCGSQYRGETFYRVMHLCVTGSTADGLRQFSALRARQGGAAGASGGLALVIRAVAE